MPNLTLEQLRWVNAVLANDEASTDAELVLYFIENGLAPAAAHRAIIHRTDAMRGSEVTFHDLESRCLYCTTPVDAGVLVCARCQ